MSDIENNNCFGRIATEVDDWMNFFQHFGQKTTLIDIVQPRLENLITTSKNSEIISFCSGSGDAMIDLYERMKQGQENKIKKIKLTMCDPHPRLPVIKRLEDEKQTDVSYCTAPIRPSRVHEGLNRGIFTLLYLSNKISPEETQLFLQNAVNNHRPVLLADDTKSKFRSLLAIFLLPLLVFILTPIVTKTSFHRLYVSTFVVTFILFRLFTYLIPLIPLLIFIEVLHSYINSYDEAQIRDIVRKIDKNDQYDWKIESLRRRELLPVPCSCWVLVGTPTQKKTQ